MEEKVKNLRIFEYWIKIFKNKEKMSLYELVQSMLAFHQKEVTAENMTKCVNKIFKDEYRGYLLLNNENEKFYTINKKLFTQNQEVK